MSLIFTMPGKLGDALLQWPVVYQYCKRENARCTLWLDEKSLRPLVPLFEYQPCVEKVELRGGIENHSMGGQPYDFGLKTSDYVDHEIYHLGFRAFPTRQITLETLNTVPLNLSARETAQEPSLTVPDPDPREEKVILHGNFTSHATGVPGFWRFLSRIWDELPADRVFVGRPGECRRALELYPGARSFDDRGDFLVLARVLLGARAVIGCGSSVAALASVLKVPCVRVHDPIGEAPKVIWSGLGENQVNDTEFELRSTWPAFRDRWLAPAVVT